MSTRTLIAAAVVALSVSLGASQPAPQAPAASPQASPSKGVVVKGKAPVSNEVLKVSLPKAQHAELANGAHLIVLEDHRVPQIAVRIDVRGAGGYFDPAAMPGVASVTAALLSEGTKTRTSQQISTALDSLAGSAGASTSASGESTTISIGAMSEHFDEVLDIAADMLLNPSFPEQEVARYKTRMKGQLAQQRAQPGFLAQEAYNRVIFGTHPASRTMTAASLDAITREALVAFHSSRYAPDFAVVGVVGDVTLADIKKRLDAKLAGWTKKGLAKPVFADPESMGPARVTLVDRPSSVQTSLIIGTQGIERLNPDYEAFRLADAIIGGGPTGRLFLNLREDKGYTYGAYSRMATGRFKGDWSASAEVRTEVTESALAEFVKEVARMRDEPIPDKEFQDKKRSLVANFALSLETPSAILTNYITSYMFGLPADYWDKYPERVMAITQAQVQAVAKKYFDPARMQVVAVGDGKKIGNGLKKFGKVEVFDTDGKPVQQQ
jgi:zinc protease